MTFIKLLRVATPAGAKRGYEDLVGAVLQIQGNAYFGFYVIAPLDGKERDLLHYYYETVE